ncbi:YisL family protein [Fructilactobacillus hinvesii]|uniref:YisL family protein n=1 Tax=Fructilactobacillus hinvesii TaxID=2940300 RepID=A0ABY5BQH6_9LACO|nr:DUF1516 family protein [Fructilactobacillus hinvesii]USS87312.1 YisL family protein [Fructilactobacillus hinvesii]
MLVMWIHFINWIILLTMATVALLSSNQKLSTTAMMVARVCYIIAIITGVIMMIHGWQFHPTLTLLKGLLGLAVIASLEIAFAHKRRHQLSWKLISMAFIFLIVVAIYGLYLTQGRPL